ncbi:IS110 family transposase, partial [Lactiplantibacillus plantarum]|uniref:IS110 family transposase n=1 Tax=Lactiplantibacillus plantarum TaxID=1590 RepID=UPI003C1F9364
LDEYDYDYVLLNPLKAKKEINQGLRRNKTDRNDAYHLALAQDQNQHQPNRKEPDVYHQLQSLSRAYEELTHDIISSKNRLHKYLQLTFPELGTIFNNSRGVNYWYLVELFPHCQDVRNLEVSTIAKQIKDFKGYGINRAQKLAIKLKHLADLAYPAVDQDDPERDEVVYYANRLLRLTADRERRSEEMIKLAKTLPNRDLEILMSIPGIAEITAVRILAELGDIRRFSNPNKINAFVGIDPGRYQSGEKDSSLRISKHGNAVARKILYRAIGQIDLAAKTSPCHIADYYERKKQFSQTKGFKKIAIASIHKLLRTIYILIITDQMYDYNVANNNQKDFCRN